MTNSEIIAESENCFLHELQHIPEDNGRTYAYFSDDMMNSFVETARVNFGRYNEDKLIVLDVICQALYNLINDMDSEKPCAIRAFGNVEEVRKHKVEFLIMFRDFRLAMKEIINKKEAKQ